MKRSKAAEDKAPEPAAVALVVARIVVAKSPKLRHRVGMFGQRAVVLIKWLLPGRVFQWVLLKAFQLD